MSKTVLLNLHVSENVRNDFKVVARLRGLTMSALINQFMVRLIREEKEYNPQAFPDYEQRQRSAAAKPSDFLADIVDGEPSETQKGIIRETVAAILRTVEKDKETARVIARIEPGEALIKQRDEAQEAFDKIMGQTLDLKPVRKR